MSQLKNFKFDKDIVYDKNVECLCVSLKEIQIIYKKLSKEDRQKFEEVIPTFSNCVYYMKEDNKKILFIKSVKTFHNAESNIAFISSLDTVECRRSFFGKSFPQSIFTGENLQKWMEIKNLMFKAKPIEVNECCVCLSDFKDVDYCFLSCGHKFHCTCLLTSIRKKNECPTCREVLDVERDKTFSEKHPIFMMAATSGAVVAVGIPLAIAGVVIISTYVIIGAVVKNTYNTCKNLIQHNHEPLTNLITENQN